MWVFIALKGHSFYNIAIFNLEIVLLLQSVSTQIFRSSRLRRLRMKFEQNWLAASEEKLFENVNGLMHACTDGKTDEGQKKKITIAHSEHSSGELKKDYIFHYTKVKLLLLQRGFTTCLGKFSRQQIDDFSYFSQKIGFDISCKKFLRI